jgi:hypothetical protein
VDGKIGIGTEGRLGPAYRGFVDGDCMTIGGGYSEANLGPVCRNEEESVFRRKMGINKRFGVQLKGCHTNCCGWRWWECHCDVVL